MRRFFRDFKKHFKYFIYAGKMELQTEVADSYLNWLWWVIEPICFMFIYSFVFGTLFGSKVDHFNIFIYIGITIWEFFNRMMLTSVKLVRSNKAIVSKVYLPKYMLVLIKMYVNTFKMLISISILIGMLIISGVGFSWHIVFAIPVFVSLYLFTFGICTLLMHFGVYVDDLTNVTRIVLRMMFYLTGVFYDLASKLDGIVSTQMAHHIAHANPIASAIIALRDCLLYHKIPNLEYVLIWLGIGLLLSILGIATVYKNENSYVKMI